MSSYKFIQVDIEQIYFIWNLWISLGINQSQKKGNSGILDSDQEWWEILYSAVPQNQQVLLLISVQNKFIMIENQKIGSPEVLVDQSSAHPHLINPTHEISPAFKQRIGRNLHQIKLKRQLTIPDHIHSDQDASKDDPCTIQKLQELLNEILSNNIIKYGYLVLLALFLLCSLFQDEYLYPEVYFVLTRIELAIHVAFLVLGVLKLIEWKNAKVVSLVFDLITSVFGIVSLELDDQTISRYFKAARTLKLILLITQIQFFNEPFSDFLKAIAKAKNILMPALVLIYVYSVIGLYAFNDFQYTKCRDPNNINKSSNWTVYQKDVYLCGELQCPSVDGIQYQCLNPIDYGISPNPDELVNIDQGNGLMIYSNIVTALFSTAKQIFVTGSSRLIILYKQAVNPIFVQIYYYSYIVLMQKQIKISSYIYLNIFYSQIITFEWTQEEEEKDQDNIDKQQKILMIKNEIERDEKPSKSTVIVDKKKMFNRPDQPQGSSSFEKLNQSSKIVENLISGTLELQKARVSNIFENVDSLQQNSVHLGSEQQQSYIQTEEQWNIIVRRYTIVNHIIILLTCINLSLDYHGQSPQFKYVVDCIDFGFYVVMVVMVLAKVVLDKFYMKTIQIYNKLEIAIVVISTGGIIYEAVIAQDMSDFFSVTSSIQGIFRSFKYIRIMMLILTNFYFEQAKLILESVIKAVYEIRNVFGLWLIVTLMFSIIGYHLHSFKTKINEEGQLDMVNGQPHQLSFDGMYNSILFTFLTFYNEQWDYIMFQQYLGSGWLIVAWQFISLLIGLILFSKYFMAVLMRQLDKIIDEKLDEASNLNTLFYENRSDKSENEQENLNQVGQGKHVGFEANEIDYNKITLIEAGIQNINIQPRPKTLKSERLTKSQTDKSCQLHLCFKKLISLLRKILDSYFYRGLWIIMIILSCLVLMNTHPHVDPQSQEIQPYLILDKVCKGFFILDLMINLSVYNCLYVQVSYFHRSYLNWINVAIIIIEIISLTELGQDEIFLKVQKIKVLRILFFVEMKYKIDWNMRITFQSFIQLLPKVCTLLTITIVIYSYFALVLVKLYKDDFYECINYPENVKIVTKNDCFYWGGDWVQAVMNTSNILKSTLYLFLVATTEGWISLMQPAMNFNGPKLQPVLNSNSYISLFFIAFFFFGNLIMLNVFIGLSVSNLKRLKDICTGQKYLSNHEQKWLRIKTQIHRLQPLKDLKEPTNCFRKYCYKAATHNAYKVVQGLFFIFFLVVMSLFKTNLQPSLFQSLTRLQYCFIGLLFVQYFIEFLAFGYRVQYKKSFFAKTIALVYSIAFIIIKESFELEKPTKRIIGACFISMQIIAYLSSLDEIPFANKILNTLVTIFPKASNIFIILLTTLLIYTIIGMQLFSFLKPGQELDQFNQNYTGFGIALFALVKFSTMESPIQQISDAARELGPNFICEDVYHYSDYLVHGQNGCGNPYSSYIFFLSFHIFYSLVLFSTLIAVIVDSYSEIKKQEEAYITKFLLYKVQQAWSKLDPQATGYIPYRQFWMFSAKLLEIYTPKQSIKSAKENFNELYASRQKILNDMSIPIYINQNEILCFQFHEVIEGLTRIYLQNNLSIPIKTNKAEKMFKERTSEFFGYKKSFYKSEHVTTLIILKSGLRWWRNLAATQNKMVEYKLIFGKFSTLDNHGKENEKKSKKEVKIIDNFHESEQM